MKKPLKYAVGDVLKWEDEEITIVGCVHYGEAGWFYVVLDEYQQEHDVHHADLDYDYD
jgi:hypothetical protein